MNIMITIGFLLYTDTLLYFYFFVLKTLTKYIANEYFYKRARVLWSSFAKPEEAKSVNSCFLGRISTRINKKRFILQKRRSL